MRGCEEDDRHSRQIPINKLFREEDNHAGESSDSKFIVQPGFQYKERRDQRSTVKGVCRGV